MEFLKRIERLEGAVEEIFKEVFEGREKQILFIPLDDWFYVEIREIREMQRDFFDRIVIWLWRKYLGLKSVKIQSQQIDEEIRRILKKNFGIDIQIPLIKEIFIGESFDHLFIGLDYNGGQWPKIINLWLILGLVGDLEKFVNGLLELGNFLNDIKKGV